jgi:hypothetical protein
MAIALMLSTTTIDKIDLTMVVKYFYISLGTA